MLLRITLARCKTPLQLDTICTDSQLTVFVKKPEALNPFKTL